MRSRRDFDTLTPEIRVRINGQDLPAAAKADLSCCQCCRGGQYQRYLCRYIVVLGWYDDEGQMDRR